MSVKYAKNVPKKCEKHFMLKCEKLSVRNAKKNTYNAKMSIRNAKKCHYNTKNVLKMQTNVLKIQKDVL